MKYLSLLIGIVILLSCSGQVTTEKENPKINESAEVLYYSKLPTDKRNVELIKKFEFEEFWNAEKQKQVGEFFGQNLYLYSYEYDTIVNGTPLIFIYKCFGSEIEDIVYQRMLDNMNSIINDMIETAHFEKHQALYSIINDEITVGTTLTYTRDEMFMVGGNELRSKKTYKLDETGFIDFLSSYDDYSSDSEFLESRLINTIDE